jgi:putative ABC transport system ATP-binding protein
MAETNQIILDAAGLHKSFGQGLARNHVLRGVNLAVGRGEFVAIMGQSGCGKSTLLHVLGLMTSVDSDSAGLPMGQIILDGMPVPASPSRRNLLRRTHIGFVFQRFNLISVLSARDNVAVSMRVRGLAYNDYADDLFERLGVGHLKNRKPGKMSIGEQQRVAVVRALAHKPALLLADEPTGNLDSDNSRELLGVFGDMNRQMGQTIIMITHSAEAATHAGRIVCMKDGQVSNT